MPDSTVVSDRAGQSTAPMPVEPLGVGAFFDMDNTVLRGSSGRLYLRYLRGRGLLSWPQWLAIGWHVSNYMIGITDFPHLMARLMLQVAGADEAEAWRISEAWFREMVRDFITDEARECIDRHRQLGHRVAIVSAATSYAVAPVARDLGLGDDYLATQLEVISGQFTGRLIEPACYGTGKVELTRAYCIQHELNLGKSYFYTDSSHDLPLLEAVGHPIAVNPDRALRRIASARRWPIERFC